MVECQLEHRPGEKCPACKTTLPMPARERIVRYRDPCQHPVGMRMSTVTAACDPRDADLCLRCGRLVA